MFIKDEMTCLQKTTTFNTSNPLSFMPKQMGKQKLLIGVDKHRGEDAGG